ncbi:two-component sensor histidine kinase [Elizabethkingia meningoseptica]|uniref:histidine kinase n=1 Tax=Elizabethkingia meningoseptica TaxID=238 RepID=A0A1V3TYP2_ELIME|nr:MULTISPECIES: ATP-binding protein [Elizabethkingia]AQX12932.1 two-component sensor histidine kinase [Elizabethkingia meningoseptica]MBG0514461.1 HAMP domain-containing protein [Elizabethkingia meningoseptica]MDE5433376.1 HAMP domain-containing protein [Elizabethkingia meningoseptica]MDE5450364.1 HAMP domain-containing protein [Elizabethkingia meningoseptica]MDE5471259.1 HAMP domain-containing protein [Elizabethkingia meningoseptica]
MKIRTRLTLLFTLITALLIGFYSVSIYYASREAREKSFYSELQNEAIAKADLFFQSSLSEREMHKLYKNNNRTLNEVQVAIYDSDYNLIYHDDAKVDYVKETPEMLSNIFRKKRINFFLDNLQVIGVTYNHDGETYIVTAAAYDQYGYAHITHLLTISIVAFVSILILIYLAGIFLAKNALKPVSEMVSQVKNITAGKLQLRLKTTKEKDELNELARSFNGMLERLENSFDAQKYFVSNISHELRTPLSAIITELELASEKERSGEEYQEMIQRTLEDARNMSKLSGSLMDLAKASYDPNEISFSEVRLDEILLESYSKILKENPLYKIALNIDDTVEEQQLITHGNEYLLQVAFNNLIDNACKYSPEHSCSVEIKTSTGNLCIHFINTGIVIPEEDLLHIFEPFYRSETSKKEKGYGIGLFLTEKIIHLHHAGIAVTSKNNTTIFTVIFHSKEV